MGRLNQNDKILRHLSEVGCITTYDAISEYGITRLASRINDLKRIGIKIDSKYKTSANRYGEKVSYKEYFLAM